MIIFINNKSMSEYMNSKTLDEVSQNVKGLENNDNKEMSITEKITSIQDRESTISLSINKLNEIEPENNDIQERINKLKSELESYKEELKKEFTSLGKEAYNKGLLELQERFSTIKNDINGNANEYIEIIRGMADLEESKLEVENDLFFENPDFFDYFVWKSSRAKAGEKITKMTNSTTNFIYISTDMVYGENVDEKLQLARKKPIIQELEKKLGNFKGNISNKNKDIKDNNIEQKNTKIENTDDIESLVSEFNLLKEKKSIIDVTFKDNLSGEVKTYSGNVVNISNGPFYPILCLEGQSEGIYIKNIENFTIKE